MASLASSCTLGFFSLSSCRSRSTISPRSHPKSLHSSPILHLNLISSPGSFQIPPCPNSKGLLCPPLPPCAIRMPSFVPRTTASSSPVVVSLPPSKPWRGAALKPLAASITDGVILWFVSPSVGVARNAWQLLATIVDIIIQPLPLGAVALMGLGASVLTKTLTFVGAFSVFSDPIPWLIALAFLFVRGFIKTGLGNRIAY